MALSVGDAPLAAPVCPRCGAPVKVRTARSGLHAGRTFWGYGRLDGAPRTSAAEVAEVAEVVPAREEAPDDWSWTLVSRAGFLSEGRALAHEAGLRVGSLAEFSSGVDRPDGARHA